LGQLNSQEKSSLEGCSRINYGFWRDAGGLGITSEYHFPNSDHGQRKSYLTKSFLCQPKISRLQFDLNLAHSKLTVRVEAEKYLGSGLPVATESNDSHASFEIIRWWLKDCCQNHKTCNKIPANIELPTRLLDLGEANKLEPRVCSSNDLPHDTKYATLSHCWGKLEFTRLTRDTLDSMQIEVPVVQLTKTFREGMEITKRLGCRYLWIDSFCIVQDDNDDWRREAAKMGSVYENAFFNIAAARGPDGRYGCYTQRDKTEVQPCEVFVSWDEPLPRGTDICHSPNQWQREVKEPIPQSQVRVTTEFLRAQIQPSEDVSSCDELGTYICHDPELWEKEVERHILKSRGWVTQEITLASRVLHFGKNQVFWECNERRACEIFPGGTPKHSAIKISTSLPSAGGLTAYGIDTRPRDVYELWDKIIELYSAAELSYPAKDKLLAIGGVASKIGIRSEYLAGLWKVDLPRQLLWTTVGKIHSRPLNEYQAPTWSWASLNGKVVP